MKGEERFYSFRTRDQEVKPLLNDLIKVLGLLLWLF
ncbi:MAG: hypothetical protein MGAcid_19390 [uncultured Acidilobus sp. MG]|nr:MAG: hypothetical protein MGAcid_19390 [uncultured Acidilobus sp. MG]